MGILRQKIEGIETIATKLCRCGKQAELIRTMLNVHNGRHVRMFECKGCSGRTWDD
ncbi:hypothetical protein M2222_003887 [Bradyrhizobium elkanii]|nr:hypothetical protein [Bradyrhizobium elkanii]MCS3561565.1 hypothetical protein [Bradyrhizobium elkanii]MCW2148594.1 hypothetical protein [Bradyrhizobium elkanii]MCW2352319.1 hypothetical protein [Bradyrhizobium elkanii]MCW2372322.1 hypothetical protein [Bradyrhizobium elkanii]